MACCACTIVLKLPSRVYKMIGVGVLSPGNSFKINPRLSLGLASIAGVCAYFKNPLGAYAYCVCMTGYLIFE
jgi:hypothetical protein